MKSPTKVHIYVDGSCKENRNVTSETSAGWGFCVIEGDGSSGNGKGDVLTELSGKVVTNSEHDGFLGAEVGSNNTAELSAIANALRWLLAEGSIEECIIRGDSSYALNIAWIMESKGQSRIGEKGRSTMGRGCFHYGPFRGTCASSQRAQVE